MSVSTSQSGGMTLLKSILDTNTEYSGDRAILHLPPTPPSASVASVSAPFQDQPRPNTSRGRITPESSPNASGLLGQPGDSRGVSNITIKSRGGYPIGKNEYQDETSNRTNNSNRRKRRARPRARYVYVDSTSNVLEKKYEELKEMISDQRRSIPRRRRYDDGLAKQARLAIIQHEMSSRGVTQHLSGFGDRLRPQSAHARSGCPKPALRYNDGSYKDSNMQQRQCHRAVTWLDLDDQSTQTSRPLSAPKSFKGRRSSTENQEIISDDCILIDATNTQNITMRKVDFTEDEILYERPTPLSITTSNRPGSGRFLQRPKSAKARLSRSLERRPRSAKTNKAAPRIISLDRNATTKTSTKDSNHSDAEESSQKSRSRERSDHQLKNTENEKLLKWLKSKDKQNKDKRLIERKEKKKKAKDEKIEEEKKEERKIQSEKKVQTWIEQKKKEDKLLAKRKREKARNISRGSSEPIISQNDMENVETVIGSLMISESKDKENSNGINVMSRPMSARPGGKTSMRRQGRPKTYQTHNTQYISAAAKLKNASNQSDQSTEQKRLSYDQWLKSKEDELHQRKKIGSGEPVDASTEKLITDIGQKRIDAIKKGKKPVDCGDEEINKQSSESFKHTSMSSNAPSYSSKDFVNSTEKALPSRKKTPVKPNRTSSPLRSSAQQPPSPTQSGPATPRPKTPRTSAYNKVKREQKSWENFADHIWKQVNEDEERLEPQGSEKPDEPVNENKGNELKNNQENSDRDLEDNKLNDSQSLSTSTTTVNFNLNSSNSEKSSLVKFAKNDEVSNEENKNRTDSISSASVADGAFNQSLSESELRNEMAGVMEGILERSTTRMGHRMDYTDSSLSSSSSVNTRSLSTSKSSSTVSSANASKSVSLENLSTNNDDKLKDSTNTNEQDSDIKPKNNNTQIDNKDDSSSSKENEQEMDHRENSSFSVDSIKGKLNEKGNVLENKDNSDMSKLNVQSNASDISTKSDFKNEFSSETDNTSNRSSGIYANKHNIVPTILKDDDTTNSDEFDVTYETKGVNDEEIKKSEESEKSEELEKSEEKEKSEKIEISEEREKSEEIEKSQLEKSEETKKYEEKEKSEETEKSEELEKSDINDESEKSEKMEQIEKSEKSEKSN